MITFTERQIRDHATSYPIFCVSFYKANGDVRDMTCTLEIPEGAISGTGRPRSEKAKAETLMVWDTDKQAIRCFRFDAVIRLGLPETDEDRANEAKQANEAHELDRKQFYGEE